MTPTNQTRRDVMSLAWEFRRSEPTRRFADCLRGAWAWTKKMAACAARFMAAADRVGGKARLAPSLIQSPIRRATARRRYGRIDDFKAAYTTAALGC